MNAATIKTGLSSPSLRAQRQVLAACLPEKQKLTLLVLLSHYNDRSGQCFPGQKTIAAKLGVTKETLRPRLNALEKRGLITTLKEGKWHRYQIHFAAIGALTMAAEAQDDAAHDGRTATQPVCATPPAARGPVFETLPSEDDAWPSREEVEAAMAALPPSDQPPSWVGEQHQDEQQQAPEQAAAPVADAELVRKVNEQRATNGKDSGINLAELATEAKDAGITPAAALRWILERSGRNFFRAEYYKPTTAGVAAKPAAPVELTKAGKRALAIRARYESGATTAPAAPRPALKTVTVRSAPLVAVGSTGTGWAREAVNAFLRGDDVKHAKLKMAADALKLSVAELKAKRAEALGVAA